VDGVIGAMVFRLTPEEIAKIDEFRGVRANAV
jgi:hypothetical protein